jgi:dTDP-6-deoxy-L-talose 4-dehydrogenase (NAD+)
MKDYTARRCAILLAQLDSAIYNRKSVFNISGGGQPRDYLPIALLIEHTECCGIFNCCSGKPISVRRLVEQRITEKGAKIAVNLGYYPYADYEPMAFWGDGEKLIRCLRLGGNDEG